MREIVVGELVTGADIRDAIHVPVISLRALRVLQPGEKLKHGCVDPFLSKPVQPGERYLFWVKPGTIKSLAHVWSHPAFADAKDLTQLLQEEV